LPQLPKQCFAFTGRKVENPDSIQLFSETADGNPVTRLNGKYLQVG
jgi:hypothetical protein